MSKKRKRSETSEADSEEYGVATATKKQCRGEWIVRRELNTEVGCAIIRNITQIIGLGAYRWVVCIHDPGHAPEAYSIY